MKKFLFTLVALGFVFSANAQSDFATRYIAGLQNFALHTLISARCSFYLPRLHQPACERAIGPMLKVADSSIRPGPDGGFVFLAFRKETIRALREIKTTAYLKALLVEMNGYLSHEKPRFNLWKFTLTYFPQPIEASRIIATLFQDISFKKLHLSYLESVGGNETYLTNKELLHRTIDNLNLIIDYRPDEFQELLYPSDIHKSLNRNIYHFYVPFYLSQALLSQGLDTQMAFTAPLLMTLTYEFITSAQDYRYLFKDPSTLDPDIHDWKIRDIYGSYLGAGLGTGKKNLMGLEFLFSHFKDSTSAAVKALLKAQ